MKLIQAFFIIAIYARSQLIVDIAWSSFTDPEFALNLMILLQGNFQDKFEFYLVYFDTFHHKQLKNSPDIIFDITFSSLFSENIKNIAEEEHTIIASISKSAFSFSNWEFFIHNPLENMIEALSSIISYLNWNTFIVISDEIYNENNFFPDKNCNWFYFSNDNNKNSSDLFIGKTIQASGIKNIVILNKGESAKLLLKSLEEQDLLINGTGIIVGSEGAWGLYGNDIISYVESGLENADSDYSYEGLALIKFLNLILTFPSIIDPFALLEFLNKNTINHHPISNFTLINTKNSQKVISGSIFNGDLTISSPLIFPGNSSIIPNSPTTSINIWIADGTLNPGAPPDLLATSVTVAEFYALDYWKSIHALDGFEITVTNTDCGATLFDFGFAYTCFSKLLTTPGVGYLTSLYPYLAIGYIYTLRSLNISMPHISPYGISSISSNQTLFPEFMTIVKDETFNSLVILDLAVIFGWKNFIVIHDPNSVATYNFFVSKLNQYNMNIANSPDLREITAQYTRDKLPQWKSWFQRLINLKVRLLVVFITPPYGRFVAESLYDLGVRRGDVLVLNNGRMSYSVAWETDPVQRRKLIEISYGSLVVAQAEWIGEYGKMIEKGFVKKYSKQVAFACLCFDAAMLLLNGIEFTIKQGENVKNFNILNENIRKQKFLGCSGTVSIEPGGNRRSLPTFGIYTVRWNEDSQSLYEELFGLYDLSSSQLITFYSGILWYDNTTNVPTDLIIYENGCPFPAKLIFRSEKGAGALYGISIVLIIITVIEAFLIWKKNWNNIFIGKLSIPVHVEFEDYIIMAVLAIDFLQFISQGPDIIGLYRWLSLLCTYSLANFDNTVSGNIYWAYLYTAIGISFYWIFTAFLLFYRLKQRRLRKMLEKIKYLSLLLLPIIGNIAFVPMVSVLLSIFQCDQGTSSQITDSFIRHDCTTYCWDNKYLIWGILSIVSLTTYIPLSIHFQHYYESINYHINLRTNPIFILEKAICQVILIIMNKTVKMYSEALHGLFCCILFIIIILLCFKKAPYNYNRMNLWLIISYLAVLWSFILSSLYWLTNFDYKIFWIFLQCSGWIILIAVGIIIQCKWCPGLLKTEKVLDIATFFKFEIGSKITAADINRMKREINEPIYLSKSKTSNVNSTGIVYTLKENQISE